MQDLGYYNGEYGPIDQMKVPMLDRALYFGDGVYEVTYTRNHRLFALDEHIDRFYNSAGLLQIKLPHTKEQMKKLLEEMVRKVDDDRLFVYWQASRGAGAREHTFPEQGEACILMMIRPGRLKDLGEKVGLITLPDTRFLHCNIKTINLIPSVMAAQRAKEAGCFEAVLHRDGRVTECAHSNVSILRDGVFVTAPTDHLILPGIARAHLIRACKGLGIPVDETPFTVDELMRADEVIVSSSSVLCLGADRIDGKPVGGRAAQLLAALQKTVLDEFERETR
ncbi:aminotransferase class IV [Feifania hominis]|uniref:Aminotransferase class IV n=1 Tax=Feifania hominis TaxID=2763660 RepID=A0A926DFM3_9FIRM|nr:aminotransferase class IV [Feifania hominis]MBC8536947.1 aminotransferase class IV [Feifania hominis]